MNAVVIVPVAFASSVGFDAAAMRLNANEARHAHNAGTAAATNTDSLLIRLVSMIPPTRGPTIDPTRPMPSAQPTPVERIAVG